jgi:predicted RNA-binding Zn-ribbon protein involved in translation (DUF1610 family)
MHAMNKIRMECLDPEDLESSSIVLLDPSHVMAPGDGDTDWACGHCEEILLHRMTSAPHADIIFRCPHCRGFSRYREIQ